VYTGSEEGPSNRELTANVITSFATEDEQTLSDVVQAPALDVAQACDYVTDAYDAACENEIAQEPINEEMISELRSLATDDDLQAVLEAQQPRSEAFIESAIDTDGN